MLMSYKSEKGLFGSGRSLSEEQMELSLDRSW